MKAATPQALSTALNIHFHGTMERTVHHMGRLMGSLMGRLAGNKGQSDCGQRRGQWLYDAPGWVAARSRVTGRPSPIQRKMPLVTL
jgi:hypothetical protein